VGRVGTLNRLATRTATRRCVQYRLGIDYGYPSHDIVRLGPHPGKNKVLLPGVRKALTLRSSRSRAILGRPEMQHAQPFAKIAAEVLSLLIETALSAALSSVALETSALTAGRCPSPRGAPNFGMY
jgi:hypothetical protein